MISTQHDLDRRDALETICRTVSGKFFVLDSETTGFNNDDEIVSIAVLDQDGVAWFDTLIQPTRPIDETSAAFDKHHITNDMVKNADPFHVVWQKIMSVIAGQVVVIYNAQYDVRMIKQSCMVHGTKEVQDGQAAPLYFDLMVPYAAVIGELNSYFGNYKWQKLPGTSHNAREDCKAVLDLLTELKAMSR